MEVRALLEENRVKGESVIGAYNPPLGYPPTVIDLVKVEQLKNRPQLMLSIAHQEFENNEKIKPLIDQELGEILGGLFSNDLIPFIKTFQSLSGTSIIDSYSNRDFTISDDRAKTSFYSLEFETDSHVVQAIGELGVFHYVSLGFRMSKSMALDEDGFTAYRPKGSLKDLLESSTPKIFDRKRYKNHSEKYSPNLYDYYLAKDNITIKSGTRLRLENYEPILNEEGSEIYYYCVRINIEL